MIIIRFYRYNSIYFLESMGSKLFQLAHKPVCLIDLEGEKLIFEVTFIYEGGSITLEVIS
jgi:hypothetical protein